MINPTIFKAYDIRGIYPDELDEAAAHRIGQAFATLRQPRTVAVGYDVRLSSPTLEEALIRGLTESGADVVRIGLVTTDQLYFATAKYGYDGGIIVSASHNPREYNGFKFAERGSGPISSHDLAALRDWSASDGRAGAVRPGSVREQEIIDDYLAHVLSFIQSELVKPLQVAANANFGAVGKTADLLADRLGLTLTRLNWEPDGSFPKGPPNPLLPENRSETITRIKQTHPDLGVAWDADADRCLFFTGDGAFIPGCFITALLAEEFLARFPGAPIIYDATLTWAVEEAVTKAGGIPVENRVGHTFIKARMRKEDAPFAGEGSGHYYFRDNFYADNGLIPFLMILELVSKSGKTLSELVTPYASRHFVAEELNFRVPDPTASIRRVREQYADGKHYETDGLTVEYETWRFNLRASNTESLLRLNVESRRSPEEVAEKTASITKIVQT